MLTIHSHIQKELAKVDELMLSVTNSEIGLIQKIREASINQSGRKLMRPSMILLSAKSINCHSPHVIRLAAIIELIHVATLLHDDVIDTAQVRRNAPSMFSKFGSKASILMGDFLYSCAFKLISELESTIITAKIAQATRKIIEGEILQFSQRNNPNTTLHDYNFIIDAKTACLFSVGNRCIEAIAGHHTTHLSTFAWHFGMAYQITDDLLDVDISNKGLNKEHGKDLSDGLMTIPSIMARKHANPAEQEVIDAIIRGDKPWQEILPIINKTKAIEHCQKIINTHIKKAKHALSHIPLTPSTKTLIGILEHIPVRKR